MVKPTFDTTLIVRALQHIEVLDGFIFDGQIRWPDGVITYSVPDENPGSSLTGDEDDGFQPLTGATWGPIKPMVLKAFAQWGELMATTLEDVGEADADITASFSSTTKNHGSYTIPIFLPDIKVDDDQWKITDADIYYSIDTSFAQLAPSALLTSAGDFAYGLRGWETLLHEMGHSLGLVHPGNYDASDGTPPNYEDNADFAQDTRKTSLMSYFGGYDIVNDVWVTDDSGVFAAYSSTPTIYDILTIQIKYGANPNTRAGDTRYGWGSNAGWDYFDFGKWSHNTEMPAWTPTTQQNSVKPIFAIYDAGGNDTLDASQFLDSASNPTYYGLSQVINLTPGSYSRILGMIDNISIAFGTIIEGAVGGNGNDRLIGNGADNDLVGGFGDDTITGDVGDDTIFGDAGDDSIDGGYGNDSIDTGAGQNTVLGGFGDDTLDASLATQATVDGGAGNDSLVGGVGASSLVGGSGNDILLGLFDNDTLEGGNGLDQLDGGFGDDSLSGGFDNDVLMGGQGNDTLSGGAGDDTLTGNGPLDPGNPFANDGADVFAYAGGADVIEDFSVGAGGMLKDTLDLRQLPGVHCFEDLMAAATETAVGVFFDFGEGNTLLLRDVALADLQRSSELPFFIFSEAPPEGGDFPSGRSPTGNAALYRETAGLPGGGFITVWAAEGGIQFEMRGADYAPGATGTVSADYGPTHVAVRADGSFLVAWQTDAGGVQTISSRLYAADGTPLGGETLLATSALTEAAYLGGVAPYNDGFVVAWTGRTTGPLSNSGDNVKSLALDADGLAIGSPVVTATEASFFPGERSEFITGWTVITGPDGEPLVGMRGPDLHAYVKAPFGAGQAAHVMGNDSIAGWDIATVGNGILGVFGQSEYSPSGGQTTLQVRYFQPGIGTSAYAVVPPLPDGDHRQSSIGGVAGLTGGEAAIAFSEGGIGGGYWTTDGFIYHRVGAPEQAAAATFTPGVAGSVVRLLLPSAVNQGYMDVAALADGRALFTWSDLSAFGAVGDRHAMILGAELEGVVLPGTQGADSLVGSGWDDLILGFGGDDTLLGRVGADTLDGGDGLDTASYRGSLHKVTVDLTLAVQAGIGHATGDILISIENLLGSAYNDTLTGNGGDNLLAGSWGDDSLVGGAGDDSLDGGAGADTMDGGAGLNTVSYAAAEIGAKVDFAPASGFPQGSGAAEGDAFISIQVLVGSAFNDTLLGDVEANRFEGGAGNDSLDGRGGEDTLLGGDGDDSYGVDSAGDVIIEAGFRGGADTVYAAVDYTLGDDLEALHLVGAASHGIGNDLDNTIVASAGGATLEGLAGTDRLEGSVGDDLLLGGFGYDIVTGDSGNDTLEAGADGANLAGGAGDDLLLGGEGSDVAEFSGNRSDYAIGALSGGFLTLTDLRAPAISTGADSLLGVDYLSFADAFIGVADLLSAAPSGLADTLFGSIGADSINALAGADLVFGVEGNDTLFGNTGQDTLHGGDGEDSLNGGTDADRLLGGAGNDTYVVDNAGDQVVEAANEGNDLVKTSVDFTLGANLERLAISGAIGRLGGGNALDNTLTGGSGADTLLGEGGRDTLSGSFGHDSLLGGAGEDSLNAGDGNDTLLGGDGQDTLAGGNGADSLDGGEGNDSLASGTGADTLLGGLGADLLKADTGADSLDGGDGADTLFGGADDDTLAGGEGADSLVGELGNDSILGGAGADRLYGNDNADTLLGGLDNDTLVGGNGADSLAGEEGADSLLGGADNDVLLGGEGADRLGGEAGDDSLVGGTGADSLNGGLDNDSLAGGADNDTLNGADGQDLLRGEAGNDNLAGAAGNDTLVASAGNDTLTGGLGSDVFRFEGLPGSGTRLSDFEQGADLLEISAGGFGGGLAAGALAAGQLRFAAASGTDAQFVYITGTGELDWAANGTAGPLMKIATLVGHPVLSASDFLVIA